MQVSYDALGSTFLIKSLRAQIHFKMQPAGLFQPTIYPILSFQYHKELEP